MMLKVTPIQSKEDQRAACEKCGATYEPDLLAYELSEEGKTLGVCQFKMAPEGGVIRTIDLVDDKFDLFYMLCAGTMNFIELCGALYAYLDAPVEAVRAKAMSFDRDESGRWRSDLKAFFSSPCKSCGKKAEEN
jgi:hypothetical protein